jgi:hypothetical protein
MRKIASSAIYVGAGFASAFVIVVLITGHVGAADRAAFFVFQTVFFPLNTFLSQSRILLRYQGARAGARGLWVDGAALVAGFVALQILLSGAYGLGEQALLAVSILLNYRGAAKMAEVQLDAPGPVWLAVPVLTGLSRVAICAGGLALGWGAALSFAAAGLVFFILPLLAHHGLKTRAARPAAQGVEAGWRHQLGMLSFFMVTALFFQWDRALLNGAGATTLVTASGVYFAWVLSPISLIFATLYRADAQKVFAGVGVAPLRQPVFVRKLGQLVLGAGAYLGLLMLLWTPLNGLMFPFFEGSRIWALVLGLAVVIDRAGLLAVFVAGQGRGFSGLWMGKAALMVAGIGAAALIGPGALGLAGFYLGFLGLAAGGTGLALWLTHLPTRAEGAQ